MILSMEKDIDICRMKNYVRSHYPAGSPLAEIVLLEQDTITRERARELVPVLLRLERMS